MKKKLGIFDTPGSPGGGSIAVKNNFGVQTATVRMLSASLKRKKESWRLSECVSSTIAVQLKTFTFLYIAQQLSDQWIRDHFVRIN